MGTTVDKLNKLLDTKSSIKDAITARGVTVPDDATFASYSTYIGQITGSGGIVPSGTYSMTASTTTVTADVTNYASVSVSPTPSETKTATENGTVTPSSGKLLSSVTVNLSYNTYITGEGEPTSDIGNDGDIYFDLNS